MIFGRFNIFEKSGCMIYGDYDNGDNMKIGNIYQSRIHWAPFWYNHVEDRKPDVEYMNVYDYYFRHSQGVFWTVEKIKGWKYNNPLVRFLFGWALNRKLRRWLGGKRSKI
eukprot:UN24396